MSIPLPRILIAASALLAASVTAHAEMSSANHVESGDVTAQTVAPVRGAVLTQVRSAFSDGERIGTLHSGSRCQAKDERAWSPLVRQRVEAELARVFDAELARSGAPASSASEAPLRVQAFVNDMDVQLCQAQAGTWQGGFYVQVGWQIVAPASGQVVYQASTDGSFKLEEPRRMTTAAGLHEALTAAVRKLLVDRRFVAMLQTGDSRRVASRS